MPPWTYRISSLILFDKRFFLGKRCCRNEFRAKGEVQNCMDRVFNIIAKVRKGSNSRNRVYCSNVRV